MKMQTEWVCCSPWVRIRPLQAPRRPKLNNTATISLLLAFLFFLAGAAPTFSQSLEPISVPIWYRGNLYDLEQVGETVYVGGETGVVVYHIKPDRLEYQYVLERAGDAFNVHVWDDTLYTTVRNRFSAFAPGDTTGHRLKDVNVPVTVHIQLEHAEGYFLSKQYFRSQNIDISALYVYSADSDSADFQDAFIVPGGVPFPDNILGTTILHSSRWRADLLSIGEDGHLDSLSTITIPSGELYGNALSEQHAFLLTSDNLLLDYNVSDLRHPTLSATHQLDFSYDNLYGNDEFLFLAKDGVISCFRHDENGLGELHWSLEGEEVRAPDSYCAATMGDSLLYGWYDDRSNHLVLLVPQDGEVRQVTDSKQVGLILSVHATEQASYLYMFYDGLQVYTHEGNGEIELVGSVPVNEDHTFDNMFVAGDVLIAHVTDASDSYERKLLLYSLSDPFHPTLASVVDRNSVSGFDEVEGFGYNFADVSPNGILAVPCNEGFALFDVSDPYHPVQTGHFRQPGRPGLKPMLSSDGTSMFANRMAMTHREYHTVLYYYDLSDPSSITLCDSLEGLPDSTALSLFRYTSGLEIDKRWYMSVTEGTGFENDDGWMAILTVDKDNQITLQNLINEGSGAPTKNQMVRDNLLVRSGGTIFLYDIQQPWDPVLLESIDLNVALTDACVDERDYLYVSALHSFQLYDVMDYITHPENPPPGVPILLDLFPNPASQVVDLRYWVEQSGIYTVTVCNVLGQQVYRREILVADEIEQGELTLHLDKVASGVYVVTLSGEKATVSKKVVVIH